MSNKTLTRSDISDSLSQKVGISRQQSINVMEAILEILAVGLVKDGGVKLSSFGSFAVRQKTNRIGRNPKTGEEVVIKPRRTLSFKASTILKQRVE